MSNEWQPIETAPLNEFVLLSDQSEFVWMIIFTKEYKDYTKATHWMPMPKPPTYKIKTNEPVIL